MFKRKKAKQDEHLNNKLSEGHRFEELIRAWHQTRGCIGTAAGALTIDLHITNHLLCPTGKHATRETPWLPLDTSKLWPV